MQLTVLYGACFLIAGAALLGITYAFVSRSNGTTQQEVVIHTAGRKAIANLLLNVSLAQQGFVRAQVYSAPGNPSARPGVRTPVTFPPRDAAGRARGVVGGGASRSVPPAFAKLLSSKTRTEIGQLVASAAVALRSQRTSTLGTLLTESGIALAIMALVSVGLGWLLAGRALRPLRTMTRRARRITEDNLHERLGGEDLRPDELGALAATFDGLLARLEQAFTSQRRFVANASHELRTPLTLQRALVEVALADPDPSPESLRHACERVLAGAEQQERLIEALLTLARGQAGVEAPVPVDLAAVVDEQLAAREPALAALVVETELEPAVVDGDRALLERLVANLLDNAIAYNLPVHGWLRVNTGAAGQTVVLAVANRGSEIPPEQVPELFEPFHKLDGERTAGRGGLGLGLSIVRAIAQAHGGRVEARPLADGGLALEVSLPRSRSAVGADGIELADSPAPGSVHAAS